MDKPVESDIIPAIHWVDENLEGEGVKGTDRVEIAKELLEGRDRLSVLQHFHKLARDNGFPGSSRGTSKVDSTPINPPKVLQLLEPVLSLFGYRVAYSSQPPTEPLPSHIPADYNRTYPPVDVEEVSHQLYQFAQNQRWPASLDEIKPLVSSLANEARVTTHVPSIAINRLRSQLRASPPLPSPGTTLNSSNQT